MKKRILALMTIVALVMCGCEKDPNGSSNNPNGNTDEPVIDITPYLGKYMMTRHTDFPSRYSTCSPSPWTETWTLRLSPSSRTPLWNMASSSATTMPSICAAWSTPTAYTSKMTPSTLSSTPPSAPSPSTWVSASA